MGSAGSRDGSRRPRALHCRHARFRAAIRTTRSGSRSKQKRSHRPPAAAKMAADPRPRSGGLANGGGGGAKRGTVKQHNVPEARPSPRSIWPDPQDRQPASIQAPRGATSLGVRLVLLMRPRPATRLSLQLNLSSSLDQLCAGASASMSAMTRPTPVVGGETEARRRGSGQSAAAARVGQRWFRDSLRFLRERKDLESARTMRLSASGSRETVPVDGRDAVTCSVTVLPNPRRAGAGMVGHFLSPPPPPPSAPSLPAP